jgi:hypothetical protein
VRRRPVPAYWRGAASRSQRSAAAVAQRAHCAIRDRQVRLCSCDGRSFVTKQHDKANNTRCVQEPTGGGAGQRPTVALLGRQACDLWLLKSLKTGTVAPAPPAIWRRRIRPRLGRSPSMELGVYHEFPVLPGRSQAECFAAGFDIVDASEEYGLDVMWLAELHFDKRRAPRRESTGPRYRDRGPHRKDQDRDQRPGASAGQSASYRRGSRDLGPRLQRSTDLRRRAQPAS